VQSQHSLYPFIIGSENRLNYGSPIYVPERATVHNTAVLNEPPPDYNDIY